MNADQAPSTDFAAELVLRWLVPLRWLAAAGQSAALAVARFALELPLPYVALAAVPALTALSNLALQRVRVPANRASEVAVGVLVADTLLFTLLLRLSGGPDNPFSAIYAIYVAMAALIGSARATWGIAALSAAGYAFLFLPHEQQHFWHATAGRGVPFQLHAVGMWVAVALVAVVLTFFMDRITRALRTRDVALRRSRELAERNARLASLTTLAAGAAHELGSPLGTIAVIARDIERGAGHSDAAGSLAEDARLLRSEVERCRVILNRMSGSAAGAGAEAGELLHAEDVEKLLGSDEGAGATSRLRIAIDAPARASLGLRADFAAVVLPLVRNALDASPPPTPIRVDVSREGERIRVSVRDDGPGMSAEVLEHAGEPFFTTRPPGRGTGLGLHVVRLHTERLGGTLRLESAPGQGTVARAEWPVST